MFRICWLTHQQQLIAVFFLVLLLLLFTYGLSHTHTNKHTHRFETYDASTCFVIKPLIVCFDIDIDDCFKRIYGNKQRKQHKRPCSNATNKSISHKSLVDTVSNRFRAKVFQLRWNVIDALQWYLWLYWQHCIHSLSHLVRVFFLFLSIFLALKCNWRTFFVDSIRE